MKTHFFNGKVVLYKRKPEDLIWQTRIKIGKGEGSWKRFSTGESGVVKAGEIACERYSELKTMEKYGVNPSPKSFKHVTDIAIRRALGTAYRIQHQGYWKVPSRLSFLSANLQ